MEILYAGEKLVLKLLLENEEINKIVRDRDEFWKENVIITINRLNEIKTTSDNKVNIHNREFISVTASFLEMALPKLPTEQRLIFVIESMKYVDNKKSKMIFDKLSELVVHVNSPLNLKQKILFIFLAYAYEKPKL